MEAPALGHGGHGQLDATRARLILYKQIIENLVIAIIYALTKRSTAIIYIYSSLNSAFTSVATEIHFRARRNAQNAKRHSLMSN